MENAIVSVWEYLRLVNINNWAFPYQIGLVGFDEFCTFQKFPTPERHRREDEQSVIDEEVGNRPGYERGVAIAEDDHHLEA